MDQVRAVVAALPFPARVALADVVRGALGRIGGGAHIMLDTVSPVRREEPGIRVPRRRAHDEAGIVGRKPESLVVADRQAGDFSGRGLVKA